MKAKATSTLIEETLSAAGFLLNPAHVGQFALYAELLTAWNARMNLTGIRDVSEMVRKHFLDSAVVLDYASILAGDVLADIGSGAGFPGVPVAILRQDVEVHLFESVSKKAAFLATVIARLELRNVRVHTDRLEPRRIPEEWRGRFDGVLSRYTASLTWLVACAKGMLKAGGWLVAHKFDGDEERDALRCLTSTPGISRTAWNSDGRGEPRRCFASVWFE